MMMYQISRPTWLVRRLKVSGVPAVSPSVVTGCERDLVHADPAGHLQPQGGALTGLHAHRLGDLHLHVGTVGARPQADRDRLLRPLTSVTVSEPEPPESVTKSVPVTCTRSIWSRVALSSVEDLVGGQLERRTGAVRRRLQRGTA